MSKVYRAAIIGAGSARQGGQWFGMGHLHAEGYVRDERCELVAVADIRGENARALAGRFSVPGVYTDHRRMLKQEKPDIVSVATYPATHAPIVIDCAKAGVKAIHCEKPMAPTWGEARRMAAACAKRGVQLTFDHQRRFLEPFRLAREMAHDGTIGELRRVEGVCSNLYDWGTHWFDMFFFYNNETPAEWVLGQVDGRNHHTIFGVAIESQGISHLKFANGVRGLLVTGHEADLGCANQLIGTEGAIELHDPAPHLRVRAAGRKAWKGIKTTDGLHGGHAVYLAVSNAIDCLESGDEPELSAARALRATEVIFATYESSRRRERIDLPLKTDDSAFLTMLDAGTWAAPKRRG